MFEILEDGGREGEGDAKEIDDELNCAASASGVKQFQFDFDESIFYRTRSRVNSEFLKEYYKDDFETFNEILCERTDEDDDISLNMLNNSIINDLRNIFNNPDESQLPTAAESYTAAKSINKCDHISTCDSKTADLYPPLECSSDYPMNTSASQIKFKPEPHNYHRKSRIKEFKSKFELYDVELVPNEKHLFIQQCKDYIQLVAQNEFLKRNLPPEDIQTQSSSNFKFVTLEESIDFIKSINNLILVQNRPSDEDLMSLDLATEAYHNFIDSISTKPPMRNNMDAEYDFMDISGLYTPEKSSSKIVINNKDKTLMVEAQYKPLFQNLSLLPEELCLEKSSSRLLECEKRLIIVGYNEFFFSQYKSNFIHRYMLQTVRKDKIKNFIRNSRRPQSQISDLLAPTGISTNDLHFIDRNLSLPPNLKLSYYYSHLPELRANCPKWFSQKLKLLKMNSLVLLNKRSVTTLPSPEGAKFIKIAPKSNTSNHIDEASSPTVHLKCDIMANDSSPPMPPPQMPSSPPMEDKFIDSMAQIKGCSTPRKAENNAAVESRLAELASAKPRGQIIDHNNGDPIATTFANQVNSFSQNVRKPDDSRANLDQMEFEADNLANLLLDMLEERSAANSMGSQGEYFGAYLASLHHIDEVSQWPQFLMMIGAEFPDLMYFGDKIPAGSANLVRDEQHLMCNLQLHNFFHVKICKFLHDIHRTFKLKPLVEKQILNLILQLSTYSKNECHETFEYSADFHSCCKKLTMKLKRFDSLYRDFLSIVMLDKKRLYTHEDRTRLELFHTVYLDDFEQGTMSAKPDEGNYHNTEDREAINAQSWIDSNFELINLNNK
ncbi:MAG: hypothetical protein MHMPM18_001305 [Marteilia pararefringens]